MDIETNGARPKAATRRHRHQISWRLHPLYPNVIRTTNIRSEPIQRPCTKIRTTPTEETTRHTTAFRASYHRSITASRTACLLHATTHPRSAVAQKTHAIPPSRTLSMADLAAATPKPSSSVKLVLLGEAAVGKVRSLGQSGRSSSFL